MGTCDGDRANCCGTPVGYTWRYLTIEIVVRALVGIVALVCTLVLDPFERFVPTDEWHYYTYPHVENEQFSDTVAVAAVVVAVIITLAVWLPILRYFLNWTPAEIAEEFTHAIFSSSLAVLLTLLVVECTKVMYGGLRPDFLERCYGVDKTLWPSPLPSLPLCTSGEQKLIKDGRKSFPSGHSGNTWSAFTWLALYNYSRISFISDSGSIRLIVPALLEFFPLVVAFTRTQDNRHHLIDIVSGGILGIFVAVVVFSFYHPFGYVPVQRKTALRYTAPAELTDGDVEGNPSEAPKNSDRLATAPEQGANGRQSSPWSDAAYSTKHRRAAGGSVGKQSAETLAPTEQDEGPILS